MQEIKIMETNKRIDAAQDAFTAIGDSGEIGRRATKAATAVAAAVAAVQDDAGYNSRATGWSAEIRIPVESYGHGYTQWGTHTWVTVPCSSVTNGLDKNRPVEAQIARFEQFVSELQSAVKSAEINTKERGKFARALEAVGQ